VVEDPEDLDRVTIQTIEYKEQGSRKRQFARPGDTTGSPGVRPPIRSGREAIALGPDLSALSARLLGETVSYLFVRWKATGRFL
jgi:hypothetical protein